MRREPIRSPLTWTTCRLCLAVGMLLATGCGRQKAPTPVKAALPPPDPREQALIERNVRDQLAREERVTEQSLVNAREAASQRRIGVQMFRDLEEQYHQRQAEAAPAGQESSSASAQPKEAGAAPKP